MAGDHKETIQAMNSHLEMIRDMLNQPLGDGQKELVREVLQQCEDQRKQMQDIAGVVIEQPGGDIIFNEITHQLEQLDEMQQRFERWSSSGGSPPMPGASAHGDSGFGGGGFGTDDFGQAPGPSPGPSFAHASSEGAGSDGRSDTRGRRKNKKKKQSAGDANEEWPGAEGFGGDAAPAGFGDFGHTSSGGSRGHAGGWPGGGDHEADGWGAANAASGGGWGNEGGGWGEGAAPAFSAHGFGDNTSGGGFGDAGGTFGADGGWGAPASGGGFPGFNEEARGSFGSKMGEHAPPTSSLHLGGWAADPPPLSQSHPGSPSSESQFATLQIQRPYAEVAEDIEKFKRSFIQSVSQATGIAPHRIRVNGVKPGY